MQRPVKLNQWLTTLIIISILISASGLFFPVTSASFSPWYGSIAKQIALSNNWSNLMLSNQDWLDKPHFPFWITAAAFKLLGINSFAYILPGFIFHLLGAFYTYRLGLYLYYNQTIALLASLIYLTTFHLILSAIDVRAEAYLLGQIMPAVYYWLHYQQKFSWKSLCLGALFTALALMTKGIFVVLTISSGIICLWLYQGTLIKNLLHPKWWAALLLTLGLTLPELIALYLQFDSQPQKIVFGHNHVSGIRWFFIDSQFGRFFGTGPIMTTNPLPYHQLFFIHTFLWAFLPWTLLYPVALYYELRCFKSDDLALNLTKPLTITAKAFKTQEVTIILIGYFWLSFIMFSLTSFQVDHYTNIIFPFAALMSANFLYQHLQSNHKIFALQQALAILLLIVTAAIAGILFHTTILFVFIALELIILFFLMRNIGQIPAIKAIFFSWCAINLTFLMVMIVNGYYYHKYDSGFLAAQITNRKPQIPVVDYAFDSRALEFFTKNKYYKVSMLDQTSKLNSFYLVTPHQQWPTIIKTYPQAQLIAQVYGNSNEQIIPHLNNAKQLAAHLKTLDIIYLSPSYDSK
jgi:4-amino-4-deoxy-L-arabinose transferase-like glycosyltransferase